MTTSDISLEYYSNKQRKTALPFAIIDLSGIVFLLLLILYFFLPPPLGEGRWFVVVNYIGQGQWYVAGVLVSVIGVLHATGVWDIWLTWNIAKGGALKMELTDKEFILFLRDGRSYELKWNDPYFRLKIVIQAPFHSVPTGWIRIVPPPFSRRFPDTSVSSEAYQALEAAARGHGLNVRKVVTKLQSALYGPTTNVYISHNSPL